MTDRVPKCLLPIQGKPILEIWLDNLGKYGINEVMINTHHLSAQVEEFVRRNLNRASWPHIYLFFEPRLLGSGGTVLENRDFVTNDEEFLIIYADNLTDMDIHRMIQYHRRHNGILTMGLFESVTPEACGIVDISKKGKEGGLIIGFEEKPHHPRGNLADAGIYVANTRIFNFFPKRKWRKNAYGERVTEDILDFGHHVLPNLIGNMYGYILDSLLIDIGTLENYELAQRLWLKPLYAQSKTDMDH